MVTDVSKVSVATSYRPINSIQYPVASEFIWTGINTGYASRSAALDVMNALGTRHDPVRKVPMSCPTSRCTWPNCSSLGVCHRCQDVSRLLVPVCSTKDELDFPRGVIRGTQPCGYRLNNTVVTGIYGNLGFDKTTLGLSTMVVGTEIRTRSGIVYYSSTVIQRAPNALLDFYLTFTPGGDPGIFRNATPVLLECLFQW